MEFRLLKAFTDHPGILLSRDQRPDLVIGRIADPFDNQVSRLRKKIEADPGNPEIANEVTTTSGTAYTLAALLSRL